MQEDAVSTHKMHHDPGAKPLPCSRARGTNLEPGVRSLSKPGMGTSTGEDINEDTGSTTGPACILASQLLTSGGRVAAFHGAGAAHGITNWSGPQK